MKYYGHQNTILQSASNLLEHARIPPKGNYRPTVIHSGFHI